ncbi:MAG: hypothetical protein Q9187_001678 [Circinaria calcarea]
MPFSSPIPTVNLSPTLSASLEPIIIPNAVPRDGAKGIPNIMDHYDEAGRRAPVVGKNAEKQGVPGGRDKSYPRPKPPGLNLLTDFTKPTTRVAESTNRVMRHPGKVGKPSQGSVYQSSKNGVTFRGEKPCEESSRAKRSLGRKERMGDGMKGPIGSLKRSDTQVTELSPSDRTLVIGISIPSSRLAESEWTTGEPKCLTVQQYAEDRCNQATPDIVVTPARVEAPRLTVPQNGPASKRRRAASSVYSQATQYARGLSFMADKPRMPPAPLLPMHYEPKEKYDEKENEASSSRVTSWGTDFDNDDNPQELSCSRPSSHGSQEAMIKRLSIDTRATRHRSQGWWNQILSPFLPRSNTTITRSSPSDNELYSAPLKSSGQRMGAQSRQQPPPPDNPKSIASPSDSEIDTRKSGRSSTWTDMSRWDAARRIVAVPNGDVTSQNIGDFNVYQEPQAVISPEFEEVSGFGAAAEYFEACWHDLNSPTAFFKCQNHECFTNEVVLDVPGEFDEPSRELVESSDEIRPNVSRKGTFHQAPGNRFSAAFAEASGVQERRESVFTEINEDPDTTPEVEEAYVAPVVRAALPVPTAAQSDVQDDEPQNRPQNKELNYPNTRHTQAPSQQLPPYSPPQAQQSSRRNVAVLPPDHPQSVYEPSPSLRPTVPRPQPTMDSRNAIPLADLSRNENLQPVQNTIHVHQYFNRQHSDQAPIPVVTRDTYRHPSLRTMGVIHGGRERSEKSGSPPPGLKNKRKSKLDNCFGRVKPKGRKKKGLYIWIMIGLVAMIVLILVLALTLTRKRSDMPVESQWLNVTGYPPIPTGISTVARPDAVVETSACVQPTTMWSCALPKEQQSSVAPNDGDQPNFRIEIRFQNGTTTKNVNSSSMGKRSGRGHNAVSAGRFIRNRLLRVRDSFTDALYTPNPPTPSQEDQAFLGNTTDGNVAPADGENTPFFVSFLPTTDISKKLRKRENEHSTNSTDQFPDITGSIPSPALNPDGTVAAANLLPFPSAQPLRIYNRGLQTEHYGFYSYFDRSIFLQSTYLVNSTFTSMVDVPDDHNGGSQQTAATVRCTWTQTRFLVQIWTNQGPTAALLPGPNSSASPTATSASAPTQTYNATTSSANDFSRPGSFPYPISITLDRHGGDISKKQIYCYGLDESEHVLSEEKKIQLEDRAFGGVPVNPAKGVFGNVNVTRSEGGPGGIDGGSGGCACQWRNWEKVG